MAHTKSGGTVKNGRDSAGKRLGVKKYDGETIKVGAIIIRQRGTRFVAGLNVKEGSDNTLYAVKSGTIKFAPQRKTNFNGDKKTVNLVSVL